MARTMFDGIRTDSKTISGLIEPGDDVAYYIDGWFAWTPEDIALFPHNQHITITVLGNPADVADCESGDMTVDESVRWLERQKAAGYLRPTIYRSLSGMADLRKATGNMILCKDWDAWVADYDNSVEAVYPGAAAKQYRSTDDYDVSSIYDDSWPHRVKIHPSAPITGPKWPASIVLQYGDKGYAVQALQKALSTSGIPGVRGIFCDGSFGQQTRTAVRNFEAARSLDVDSGIAGPLVRSELISLGLLNSAGQATR
jgi:hypothetical protein